MVGPGEADLGGDAGQAAAGDGRRAALSAAHRPTLVLPVVGRCFRPRGTAYYVFRGFHCDGAWETIAAALVDAKRQARAPAPTAGLIDSQTVQATAGGPATDPLEHDAGKRGKQRRRHLPADTPGLPLRVACTRRAARHAKAQAWSSRVSIARPPSRTRLGSGRLPCTTGRRGGRRHSRPANPNRQAIRDRGLGTAAPTPDQRAALRRRSSASTGRNRCLGRDHEGIIEAAVAFIQVVTVLLLTPHIARLSDLWSLALKLQGVAAMGAVRALGRWASTADKTQRRFEPGRTPSGTMHQWHLTPGRRRAAAPPVA
jgi:hypothetical protein